MAIGRIVNFAATISTKTAAAAALTKREKKSFDQDYTVPLNEFQMPKQ